jgi:hypothetical protein
MHECEIFYYIFLIMNVKYCFIIFEQKLCNSGKGTRGGRVALSHWAHCPRGGAMGAL